VKNGWIPDLANPELKSGTILTEQNKLNTMIKSDTKLNEYLTIIHMKTSIKSQVKALSSYGHIQTVYIWSEISVYVLQS